MSYQQYRPMRWQILPPVVKNLMIINGIMYLATVVFDERLGLNLTQYLGLHYFTSEFFRPHQFLTHLFMHGSLAHIAMNMFSLWMFGNVLENVWGGKKFLMYYLITGMGAALIHTGFTWYEMSQLQHSVDLFKTYASPEDFSLFVTRYNHLIGFNEMMSVNDFIESWRKVPTNPAMIQEAGSYADMIVQRKANIPTVGASGAVYGVLLAYGMMFPNTLIYVYLFLPIKAKWFVFIFGAIELYTGLQNNPGDNVAHFAHLGGMLFGYLLIRSWKRKMIRPFDDEM